MEGTVFIANARPDAAWAQRLSDALEHAGIKTWVDLSNIPIGTDWERSVIEALRASSALIVVVTRRAAASAWVAAEIKYAQNAGIKILPVMVEDDPLPGLERLQHFDLRGKDEVPPSFVEEVKRILSPARPAPSPLVGMLYEALSDNTFSEVLDELTQNVVLLLGNFEDQHKERLMMIHAVLDRYGMHPVIFDFVRPESSDFGETIRLLAGFSAFIVADMNSPRSVLMELQLIVPALAIPVVPIVARGFHPPALFVDLRKYDWVLEPVEYQSFKELTSHFKEMVIEPAKKKRQEINTRKEFGHSSDLYG